MTNAPYYMSYVLRSFDDNVKVNNETGLDNIPQWLDVGLPTQLTFPQNSMSAAHVERSGALSRSSTVFR